MPPASPSTAPRHSARPAAGASGFDATYDIVALAHRAATAAHAERVAEPQPVS
jgi:hypothetical protein